MKLVVAFVAGAVTAIAAVVVLVAWPYYGPTGIERACPTCEALGALCYPHWVQAGMPR